MNRAIIAGCLLMSLSLSACNPFAPGFDDNPAGPGTVLGDRTTIEGVFQDIKYSYTFRDTTIFGQVLHQDFLFSYRDYDRGTDVVWGRDDEMRITMSLFRNVQQLDLIWNNVLSQSVDSAGVSASVSRYFTLTVTFNPSDILRADGYVTLALVRPSSDLEWQVYRWRDDSEF